MKVYFDFHDWWVGYYRGDTHHYVCPFPTLVVRWRRKPRTISDVWDAHPEFGEAAHSLFGDR